VSHTHTHMLTVKRSLPVSFPVQIIYRNILCGSSAVEAPNESTLRQNFQQIQEGESRQVNRPVLLPAYKPGVAQPAAEQPRAKPSPVPQPRADVLRNDIADHDHRRIEQAPPPQPKMGRLIRKLRYLISFNHCTFFINGSQLFVFVLHVVLSVFLATSVSAFLD